MIRPIPIIPQCARRVVVTLLTAWALSPFTAYAVNSTWKVGGPSLDWFEPLNWTAGVPQNAGDVARFSNASVATTQTQLNSPATITQLVYTGLGTFQFTGSGPLTFFNPSTSTDPLLSVTPPSNGSLFASINVPIIVPSGETLNVSLQGQARISLMGPVSGDGSVRYSGSPTGQLSEIRGNNTYTGLTTIDIGNRAIDVPSSTAFGDPSRETIVRNGSVSLWEGTAEPFTVLRGGTLLPSPSSILYSGRITLAGGTLNPDSRFINGSPPPVSIDAEIAVQGRGYIGRSPYSMENTFLKGPLTGGGLLIFQGDYSESITAQGPVQIRGDVLASDRSNTIVTGEFRPAGDLAVDGGIASGNLKLAGDNSAFHGDIETRLGYLDVATNVHADTLKVDARLATWRESLQRGGLTVESGASLDADHVQFYAGGIAGRLTGVDQITKQTRIAGSLSRLDGFDGDISVEGGWLDVVDSGGLGTTVGSTSVVSPRNAAIALYPGARVEDTIHLNNSSGFDYQGSLLGPGEFAGQLDLGDVGSYVGGLGSDVGTFNRDGNLKISGSIHGGALNKAASYQDLTLTGSGHTYTGATNILGGQLILTEGARLETTSGVRVSGQGTLLFDDRGAIRSTDRLADNVPIRLDTGRLQLLGQPGLSRETVGQVTLGPGFDRVYADGGVLHINQLQREPGAIAKFLPGTTGRIEFGSTPVSNGFLGGWALYFHEDYRPDGFASFLGGAVASAGALNQSLNVSTASQNVQVSNSNTLSQDVAVNSIKTTENAPIDLNGHKLAIASGGLLALGDTTISNGTLTAGVGGPAELFLHDYWNLSVAANIQDNGGGPVSVNVSGIGQINFSGTNTYTGGTHILSGGLHVLNRSAVPAGDVVDVNGGAYVVDFNDGQPLKLNRLILRGVVDGSTNTPIDADAYETYSGQLAQPVAGSGAFIKKGEGQVLVDGSMLDFHGSIAVEQGLLTLPELGPGGVEPNEATAIKILAGGAVSARAIPDSRLVILDGGELRLAIPSGAAATFPIEVRGQGTIQSIGQMNNAIRGQGNLTIDGPFDNNTTFAGSVNQLQGDLTLTGGTVSISGNNALFQGVTHIRGAGVLASSINAFGPAGAVVHPEGILNVAGSLAAPVRLDGGVLRSATPAVFLSRPIRVSADSVVDTPEADSASLILHNFRFDGLLSLDDNVRLKKTGSGKLTIAGGMNVGQGAELVAWEGSVELFGTLTAAKLGSTLNIRGNDNFTFNNSFSVPTGTSFQLLNDGVPAALRLAASGARLSGGGTIEGDVTLSGGAAVAPGASPGTLAIGGDLTLGAGATYDWEVANLLGTAGAPDGWDLLHVMDNLIFDATPASPWKLKLTSLSPPGATSASANVAASHQWLIAQANQIIGFNPAAVVIDSTNLRASHPEYATGNFGVTTDGGNLYLTFVPEPASLGLMASMLGAAVLLRRRR